MTAAGVLSKAPAEMERRELEAALHQIRSLNGRVIAMLELGREFLASLPQQCRYHGRDFDRLGRESWGEPRCESCRLPAQVVDVLDKIDKVLHPLAPLGPADWGA